jgi:DNA polymerase-3 subunit gamma/tau
MDREPKNRARREAKSSGSPRNTEATYTVVARRYRPQRFEDVVGQEHVVRALRNAVRLNRIAQAYLFCGTRGVGKTSIARIFAKCLNCVQGPTEEPCQVCDICQAIASGQDVDVIEIDGASNNGVEQVRELRQNVALRPSRARFKIYYIDEVHMLSTGAFNALLKTLEEPPPHVKFFFATTEPGKIPITVLSRCQRYDFAGITPDVIAASLSEICLREHVDAEPEALQVVARRAGGSLRDAQSLLDRLLASGTQRLTAELVHGLLGTASDERLFELLAALADHDSAAALRLVEQAMSAGIQPAELLGGLIDFVRDAMVTALGAGSILLAVSPRHEPRLKQIVERWTLDSILAALQILGEARTRMRGSVHGRLLLELALVRVARLEKLAALSTMVERLAALESGNPTASAATASVEQVAKLAGTTSAKRRTKFVAALDGLDPAPPSGSLTSASPAAVSTPSSRGDESSVSPSAGSRDSSGQAMREAAAGPELDRFSSSGLLGAGAARDPEGARAAATTTAQEELPPLELATARRVWPDLVKKVGANLGWRLSQVEPVAALGSDVLVIAAKPGYNSIAEVCATPEALVKIGQGLQRLIHRPVSIRYQCSADGGESAPESRPNDSRRRESLEADPMVQMVIELFEAHFVHADYGETDQNSAT